MSIYERLESRFEEDEDEDQYANWDLNLGYDAEQFLSDLTTQYVRTIPIQRTDDPEYINAMKTRITDMFNSTESRFQIDSSEDRLSNKCIYLHDGLEPCGEEPIDGYPCCVEHLQSVTRLDWFVLSVSMVGLELGEVLYILENDIDPEQREFFLRNRALPEVIVVIMEEDLDEQEVVKLEIPKYEEMLQGATIQDCPVCLDELVKTTIKLVCSHSLCYSCLEKLEGNTCPCCRTVIDISQALRV